MKKLYPARKAHLSMLSGVLLTICPIVFSAQNSPVLTGKKMEVLEKGQRVIFSDGAEIKDGVTEISAEIIIHDRPGNFLETKNDVHIHHILKSSATIDIFGESGYYRLGEQEGYLAGNPVVVDYLPSGSTDILKLQCQQIDFNLKSQEVSGRQEVRVNHQNSRIRADSFQGNFAGQNSFLSFSAAPKAKVESFYDYGRAYDLYSYSRQLDFYPEEKQVKFRGEVVTKIIPR